MNRRTLSVLFLLACRPDEAKTAGGYKADFKVGSEAIGPGAQKIGQTLSLATDPLLEGVVIKPGEGGMRLEVVRGPLMRMTGPRMIDSSPPVLGAALKIVDQETKEVINGRTDKNGVWVLGLRAGVKALF